jgi:RNase P/RNase MRP subunit POP5
MHPPSEPGRDWRSVKAESLVIAELARSEAALIEECREHAAEAAVYRLMVRVLLAEVERLTVLVARLTGTIRRMRREMSRYTAERAV